MPGIIVGVDGSEHSRRALEWAVREAALRQAPLTVLTVNPAVSGTFSGHAVAYPGDPELAQSAHDAARRETLGVLVGVGADARPPGVTVHAMTGLPAEELIQASQDAELVVVGSRGAGRLRRLMTGSVCAQVSQHARCPVVVIPAAAADAG
jgi:nucleotide-binding universal stress UspA family protein